MATQQMLKLDVLNFEYQAFRENQLLTHKQLNDVIDFFEDQDRLTRTCLLGVGIVCGLKISISGNTINLTKGCAVTTDGDLLVSEAVSYADYKPYSNLSHGTNLPVYDPFFPPSLGGKQQMELYELVVPDSEGKLPEGTGPLSAFNTTTGKNMTDMAALLYLEYYLRDADLCSAINCDNQGPLQNARLKVLLISTADMDKVIGFEAGEAISDSIFKKWYDAAEKYYDFPELKVKRLLLNNDVTTASITSLRNAYAKILSDGVAELTNAIATMGSAFNNVLNTEREVDVPDITKRLPAAFTVLPSVYDVQYMYDFYKDIVDCYNELRYALYDAVYVCCPDKYAFPKHVMLGLLSSDATAHPQPYRHIYYPSPIAGNHRDSFKKAQSLWKRLNLLVYSFSLPSKISPIKFTPSLDSAQPLGWRAIPFYYRLADTAKEFIRHWNTDKTDRGSQTTTLSYNAAAYSSQPSVTDPFLYDIDKYDFYRVEGHIGKKLEEALPDILQQRTDKSLAVEVTAVSITDTVKMTDININDYAAQFDDLNTILNSWVTEQNCLFTDASKFFSAFNLNPDKKFRPDSIREVYGIKDRTLMVVRPAADAFASPPLAAETSGESRPLFASARTRLFTSSANALASSATAFTSSDTARSSVNAASRVTGMFAVETAVKSRPQTIDDFYQPAGTGQKEVVTAALNKSDASINKVFAIEDLLGSAFVSADVVELKLKDAAERAKDTTLKGISDEDKQLILLLPGSLLALMHAVTLYKPFTLNDLSTGTMDSYKKALDALCDKAIDVKDQVAKIIARQGYVKRGFEDDYMWWVSMLASNCCAAERIQVLLDEIDNRKEEILGALTLTEYAKKHPGLEHKAGVPRGGTLVLVYANVVRKTVPGNLLTGGVRPEIVPARFETTEAAVRQPVTRMSIKDIDDKEGIASFIEENNGAIDIPDTIHTFLSRKGVTADSLQGQNTVSEIMLMAKNLAEQRRQTGAAVVTDKTIIADFCLPYACCSNLPSATFILPKPQFVLMLAKDAACSDDEELEFRKEPAGGKVAAAAGFEDTVRTDGTRSFFVPKNVKPEQYGQAISFTIDGQVTSCTIKVVKHPVASFTATVKEETATRLSVSVVNTSDDATGKAYTYLWKVKDGAVLASDAVKDPKVFTFDKQTLGDADKIILELTAINGICSGEPVTQEVVVTKLVVTDLSLAAPGICEDGSPVEITGILPAEGTVKATGLSDKAVTKNADGKTFFNPSVAAQASLLDTPVSFTVNDVAVPGKTITVFRKPVPSFLMEGGNRNGTSFMIKVADTTPNKTAAYQYTWSFNDGSVRNDTDGSFNHTVDLTRITGTTVIASLTVTNGTCTANTSSEVVIPADTAGDCRTAVTKEMTALVRSFTRASTQTQNPKLVRFSAAILSLYKKTLESGEKMGTPDVQSSVLKEDNEIMSGLVTAFSATELDAISVAIASAALSMVIRLPLYTMSCTTEVDDIVKKALTSFLKKLMDPLPNNAKAFADLNKGKSLSIFIDNYTASFLSRDRDIIKLLSEFMKVVNTFIPAT